MKAVDLRTKSDDELKAQLLNLRKEQFNLRFQKASGQLDIARIKTLMDERAAEARKSAA